MAIDFSTEYIGGGWAGSLPLTKAHEVEKLVAVAESCGIEKDIKLFDYLVNLVYRGSTSCGRIKNAPRSLAEAMASPINPDITINMGNPSGSVDIGELSNKIVKETMKQKGAFA